LKNNGVAGRGTTSKREPLQEERPIIQDRSKRTKRIPLSRGAGREGPSGLKRMKKELWREHVTLIKGGPSRRGTGGAKKKWG